MNLYQLKLLLNQAQATWYRSHTPELEMQVHLPRISYALLIFERLILVVLIFVLLFPMLKEQLDPAIESRRRRTLKLVAFLGGAMVLLQFLRAINQ